ncbi:MAG: regulatory protein RecX [Bacteroidales bacterium]|nr:regulatory protein RecX [Bacteroidales bacterium]MBR0055178.1 regulatory protein RecX [Bacteroidales bacterium]
MQTLADKVMKFCSYQERSRLEVRRKMAALKMPPAEAERLLVDLVEMNFVSDERFAESFIRGKMNIKRWGKVKMRVELHQRGISDEIINQKFDEIDDEQYFANLRYLVEKWSRENPQGEKVKLIKFLLSKGYEMGDINAILNSH